MFKRHLFKFTLLRCKLAVNSWRCRATCINKRRLKVPLHVNLTNLG